MVEPSGICETSDIGESVLSSVLSSRKTSLSTSDWLQTIRAISAAEKSQLSAGLNATLAESPPLGGTRDPSVERRVRACTGRQRPRESASRPSGSLPSLEVFPCVQPVVHRLVTAEP
jgi:hypothetical protein